MPAGCVINAPIAPMPPALATAIERLAGHAPAIGASKTGSLRPYFAQKALARSRGAEVLFDQLDCDIGVSRSDHDRVQPRLLIRYYFFWLVPPHAFVSPARAEQRLRARGHRPAAAVFLML